MGKVRFRSREMVKITFLDKNVVQGSTIYVDPGTHLTQQNQAVRDILSHNQTFYFTILQYEFQHNHFC